MRFLLIFLLPLVMAKVSAQELTMFAPAVRFTNVKWWGPGDSGLMVWTDGKDQTPYPANVGEIREARLDKTQEIRWRNGSYQIQSVTLTKAGAIEVRFEKGTLLMTRTPNGYFSIDVFPPESQEATARFLTTVKSTAHDKFEDPPRR